ncbi:MULTISPECIES: glycosyltransferase [unclassified Bradyrhizobium]|uniref:CgeB family protein n=1 Tax=unclassified Bradyrhizobium TaxID=2631580 RepID=UPI001CD45D92|nr:glycosyltransferase [Bradyrhizobium sp. NBAIM14]MCA1532985.1 glycosyltransferase [Bradyrhizobium sp. NBAIM03]
MKIIIFGLTISSSWGNGHATLWRGLCKHLARSGHSVVFFERDVPYYSGARDLYELPGGALRLFANWDDVRQAASAEVRDADVAIVTSYCPDAIAATELILAEDRAVPVFYDLDTPVTLARLIAGEAVPYIGPRGLRDFALVLSFTGGPHVADEFRNRLGARDTRPLYGHVDTDIHHPVAPQPHYRADLSYLGTYSEDRQHTLEALFVAPARARQDLRFLIGGAQYPDDFPWSPNIYFVRHLPPSEHAPFFASSRLTLNVTRRAMAEMGWCPSGRLFEAAACGAPLLSDDWPGIADFFAPGEEILIARDEHDALAALAMPDAELRRMALRAYERTMDQHTSDKRARELISMLEQIASSRISRQQIEEA